MHTEIPLLASPKILILLESEGNGRTHATAPLYFSGSIIPETKDKDV